MNPIYKFKIAEKMFALDVENCFFFEIDEITWEVLEYYDKLDTGSILSRLEQRFAPEDLEKVIQELNFLREEGHIMRGVRIESPLKESYLMSISLQLEESPGNDITDPLLMTQLTAQNSINFLIMKSGENKTLKVNFLVAPSLSNLKIIEHTFNYAQKLGEVFKKSLTFGLTLTRIPLEDKTNRGEIDISFDLGQMGDIQKTIEYLSKEKKRGGAKLSRIRKISLSRNSFPRVALRPVNLNFSGAIVNLFGYGFRDICFGCHNSLAYLSSEEGDKIFEEYNTLARDYINRLEKGDPLFLHPFVSIFEQVGKGERCVKRCQGGKGDLTIGAMGNLYPCPRFLEVKEYCMGNVNTLEYNLDLEEKIGSGVNEKEGCRNCWVKYICGGGCPALAFYHNRDTQKPYGEECRSNQYIIQLGIMVYSILHEMGLAKGILAHAEQPFVGFSLKGGKINLRPVGEGDLPIISQWNTDFDDSYFLTEEIGAGRFRVSGGGQGVIEFLIEEGDKSPLGLLRLRTFPPSRKGEISLFTPYKERLKEKEFHQVGISILRHLFRVWRLPRIYATFLENETDYIEYLMQFGFKSEGILREHLFHKGRYHNLITLGYIRGFITSILQKSPGFYSRIQH